MAKKFKALSFSTTLRNPMRIFEFLHFLQPFENQILTEDICVEYEKLLIKNGLYKPKKEISFEIKQKWSSSEELTDEEAEQIMESNPQDHKEANFEKGWPSRFQTHVQLLLELGFVWVKMNQKLKFTNKSKMVLEGKITISEALNDSVLKSVHGNPFRKGTANKQHFLLNLLKTLEKYKTINEEQLYFLMCLKDDTNIPKIPSDVNKKYIEEHWGTSFNDNAYEKRREGIDDVKRKIKLTNLFHFEENLIKLNSNFVSDISKIIDKMQSLKMVLKNEEEYFNAMSNVDFTLDNKERLVPTKFKEYWMDNLTIEECKELINKIENKTKPKNIQLKNVQKFIIFELAVGILIQKCNPSLDVSINLNYDDNFTPTAPAPGGMPDITIKDKDKTSNVEVTLLKGVAQHSAESQSTIRHLKNTEANSLMFIAPRLSRDLVHNYQFEQYRRPNINFSAFNTKMFIQDIEEQSFNSKLLSVNSLIRDTNLKELELFEKINQY